MRSSPSLQQFGDWSPIPAARKFDLLDTILVFAKLKVTPTAGVVTLVIAKVFSRLVSIHNI